MQIEGIQFMRPNGREVPVKVPINDELTAKWREIQDAGLRLTAEVLISGDVSVALEERELGDFAIELCGNEPGCDQTPTQGVEKMIREFSHEAFDDWKREAIGDV